MELMTDKLDFDSTADTGKKSNRWGLLALGIVSTGFVGLSIGVIPFVTPALRKFCLPYVPASDNQVKNIFSIIKRHSSGRNQTLVDIGSGDGRIVISAAKLNYKATGYELNPWLVLYSQIKSWRENCYKNTTFKKQNLWKANFSSFDNIVIFGVEQMMEPLGDKLQNEMHDEARVIACRFSFPHWKPIASIGEGIDTVWLYKKEKSVPRVKI